MKKHVHSSWALAALAFLLSVTMDVSLRAAPVDFAAAPRASLCLNGEWENAPAGDDLKMPETGWAAWRLPSAPVLDPKITARWCRVKIQMPKEWARGDRRFFIGFEEVGHYAAVFCNGQKVGEHFGQYAPFECDVTGALKPGAENVLAVFVHNASGKFVRPGADITDDMTAKAYRPAANQPTERNWVGISGDITLSWRPSGGLADVFVDTSVREHKLSVTVENGATPPPKGSTLRAAVLDGDTVLLELPPATASSEGKIVLTADWSKANPVLWGRPPYGEPKLYTLRTELVAGDRVLDRVFTRFGFREVWLSGKDVLLNGHKLWLVGTYHTKHSPVRDINDARPMSAVVTQMQEAGLNTLHGHWDDLGQTWLDVCDKMGMFVLAGFFCDGRPQIQTRADAGWADWMTTKCTEWVRARRNHPSILAWRPTDVMPPELQKYTTPEAFKARLAAEVRRHDPSHRPLADDSDVLAWGQPPENQQTGEYNNFTQLQNAPRAGKPFLCKEIYGGIQAPEKFEPFVREFYRRSFDLGGSGVLVQQLPLQRMARPFAISWLSPSGPGNRDVTLPGVRGELPNWCDATAPAGTPTPYVKAFSELHQQYLKVASKPAPSPADGVLVSGLPGKTLTLFTPEAADAEPGGLLTDKDGNAWVTLHPGTWWVAVPGKPAKVEIAPALPKTGPGYSTVQRISVGQ